MAKWIPVVVSGSDAKLNSLLVTNSITSSIISGSQFSGSFSGSFHGDGTGLKGIPSGSQGTTGAQGTTGGPGVDGSKGDQGIQGSTGTQGPIGIQGTTGNKGETGSQGTEGSFGGATFDYTFTSSISVQDPGQGKLGANNTTQSSATILIIDSTDDNGTNINSFLNTILSVTSAVKGFVRLSHKTDANEYVLYAISDLVYQGGSDWWTINVTSTSYSATSPLYEGEDLLVSFTTTGDRGDKGQKGEIGNKGDTGTQGPTGTQGTTGTQGPTGVTGDKGDIGAQGPTGIQGTEGIKGSKGEQGDKGDQGVQGITGPQGTTGSQGTTGDKGDLGPQGATGSQGTTGDKGEIGPQGTIGSKGEPGAQGTTGDKGALGPQGATGDKGDQGVQGVQGIIGDKGDVGAQGPTGTQGPTGPQGITGDKGDIGSQGVTGDKGAQGTSAATAITNNVNNYLVTATGDSNTPFNGESTLTYSASVLTVPDIAASSISASYATFTSASIGYLQTVSGSVTIIGDSYIILNNDTPTERYAGMAVYDSGSVGVTSSFNFDGLYNNWFYEYTTPGGTDYAVTMFGPEYTTKGTPVYLTNNYIPKSTGTHHLGDSQIQDDGTLVTIGNDLLVKGDTVAFQSIPNSTTDTNVLVMDNSGNVKYRTNLSLQGPTGPQGPVGDKGALGPQGTTGDKGALGPQGPVGDKGDLGVKGATGDKGALGPQGPVGDKGAIGPQGTIGGKGEPGAQGTTGDKGALGPQGITGDKGNIGAQGPVGDKGALGPQGTTGDKGALGAQGPIGDKGDKGALGPQGPVGDKGAIGPQGTTGGPGPAGDKGATGAQGPIGDKGALGSQGATGGKGEPGTKGEVGAKGDIGPQGPSAATSLTNNVNNYLVTATGNSTTPFNGESTLTFDGTKLTLDGKMTIDQVALNAAGTPITWNLLDGSNSKVTLAGSNSLAITNVTVGDTGVILVKQGTGTVYNLTLPSGSVVIGGGNYTTTTTSNGVDVLGFYYDGTNYYWSVPNGITGPTGAKGEPGVQGTAGAQGATGTKGEPGTTADNANTVNAGLNTTDATQYVVFTPNNNYSPTASAMGTVASLSFNPNQGIFNVPELRATGEVYAYYASDERLKDNITPILNALDKVNQIGGYEFDWNDKQSSYTGHDIGVIAQEIESILPELVTTRDTGYKAVKYDKIVALLIQAIKEQQVQIQNLEKKVNE